MSLAWANKQTDYFGNLRFFKEIKIFIFASVIIGIILAYLEVLYSKTPLIIYLKFHMLKEYQQLTFGIKVLTGF